MTRRDARKRKIRNRTRTGLDVLFEQKGGPWRGKRWGMILHQASVTRSLRPALEILMQIRGIRLVALFAPEHGLGGALQDQIPVAGTQDRFTGLPVYSLYGEQRSPSQESLRAVDVLLFDLQDIGVRYYTFIWTMVLAMKAAARAEIPFVVLDRPNPLGGEILEGNIPDPGFASFVGLYPLPVRHGMTCGELARYFNERFGLGCDLHVVKVRGWRRSLWQDETGLPWVMPSPNMPTLDTATVYAGACLLEGTNLSEGRGTTRPFEIAGAPFLDSSALAREMNRQDLPGVWFRPCAFQPTFHKWARETCQGVQLHVTNRRKFRSFLTGLTLLQTVKRLYSKEFQWRRPPYEYEKEKMPMDILCGTDALRNAVEKDLNLKKLEAGWSADLHRFRKNRKPFLLY